MWGNCKEDNVDSFYKEKEAKRVERSKAKGWIVETEEVADTAIET